jgi:hypothetical protein
MDGGAIVDGRAIVDGERDATKQEISLAERPRGKRLIAPRTTVIPGELLAENRTKPKYKEWRGNPEFRPSQLYFKLNPKEYLNYF